MKYSNNENIETIGTGLEKLANTAFSFADLIKYIIIAGAAFIFALCSGIGAAFELIGYNNLEECEATIISVEESYDSDTVYYDYVLDFEYKGEKIEYTYYESSKQYSVGYQLPIYYSDKPIKTFSFSKPSITFGMLWLSISIFTTLVGSICVFLAIRHVRITKNHARNTYKFAKDSISDYHNS